MLPEPEALGLLALMLLHDSRRAARVSADGEIVLLDRQDRSLWDQDQIAEGTRLVERTLASRRAPGPYAIQGDLRQSGSPRALESVETATTVRMRHGKLSITDGPFAETKEQLAGFYLVEARDLNEAIQIAGRIPPARTGCIEVRPVRELSPG